MSTATDWAWERSLAQRQSSTSPRGRARATVALQARQPAGGPPDGSGSARSAEQITGVPGVRSSPTACAGAAVAPQRPERVAGDGQLGAPSSRASRPPPDRAPGRRRSADGRNRRRDGRPPRARGATTRRSQIALVTGTGLAPASARGCGRSGRTRAPAPPRDRPRAAPRAQRGTPRPHQLGLEPVDRAHEARPAARSGARRNRAGASDSSSIALDQHRQPIAGGRTMSTGAAAPRRNTRPPARPGSAQELLVAGRSGAPPAAPLSAARAAGGGHQHRDPLGRDPGRPASESAPHIRVLPVPAHRRAARQRVAAERRVGSSRWGRRGRPGPARAAGPADSRSGSSGPRRLRRGLLAHRLTA